MNSKKYSTKATETKDVKVVDALRPLYFDVKNGNIYGGNRRDKNNCVLACALREKIPTALNVEVGTAITKIRFPRKIVRYSTPSTFSKQIKKWDDTGRWLLPPGEYRLNPVKKTATLGARPGRPHSRNGHKTNRTMIPGTKLQTTHPTRWITI